MVKKIKYNADEAKALSLELQVELLKLKTALNKLETNVVLLQDGGNWNGANAYEVNQSLIGHIDHDRTLLSKLEKCSISLNELTK
jgi:hypothetical protein